MDRAISRWILVFVAKQIGINCSVFKSLLSVLPLPDDDLLLKKLNLLCRIRFQVGDDSSITEDMLHWLEVIEELDSLNGVASVSASMVKAYLAVAVECTVRHLPGKMEKNSQYLGAFERIWRGRIRFMELAGSDKRSRLLTGDLLLWRTCLEDALTDETVRCDLLKRNVRTEAFNLLKAYLDEEMKDLLPLLGVPAKSIPGQGNKSGDPNIGSIHPRENLKRHAPFEAARIQRRRRLNRGVRIADEDEDLPDPQKVTESLASDKHKKSSDLEHDVNVAPQSGYVAEDPLPTANQVTKQPPSDQPEGVLDHGMKNPLPDAHKDKETEMSATDQHNKRSNLGKDVTATERSLMENNGASESSGVLDRGMKNPLPDAHKETEMPATDQHNKISNLGKDVSATERSLMKKNGPSESSGVLDRGMKNPLPDAHKETEMPATDQHNKISNLGKDVSATERSLMEKNGPSESSVPEKSRNQPCNVRVLPTYNLMNPNRTANRHGLEEPEGVVGRDEVNPNTRPQEIPNPNPRPNVMPIRRFRRPWSSEEEDALRAGVEKFGQGQWKFILDCYSESLEGRTSTDLKDKWRNMNRYPIKKN